MIECGWCGASTGPGACSGCGRDPAIPWLQRQRQPRQVGRTGGRPTLDAAGIRRDYVAARDRLLASGRRATVEEMAEALDVSDRTVRDWRHRFGLPS